jgi:hypothetical protein
MSEWFNHLLICCIRPLRNSSMPKNWFEESKGKSLFLSTYTEKSEMPWWKG